MPGPLWSYESFYVFRASEYPFNRVFEPGLCSNHYLGVFLSRVPFSALVEREAKGTLEFWSPYIPRASLTPVADPDRSRKNIKGKTNSSQHAGTHTQKWRGK